MGKVRKLGFLATLLCAAAYSQETTGGIRGTVTDPTGAAVPNAKVELSGVNLGRPMTTTSTATGAYQFTNVPVGPGYTVTVTADGFHTAKAGGLAVEIGKATTLEVKLEVGSLSETVWT